MVVVGTLVAPWGRVSGVAPSIAAAAVGRSHGIAGAGSAPVVPALATDRERSGFERLAEFINCIGAGCRRRVGRVRHRQQDRRR